MFTVLQPIAHTELFPSFLGIRKREREKEQGNVTSMFEFVVVVVTSYILLLFPLGRCGGEERTFFIM